ncbi:ABC transporter ATP-binding protein [uncultured Alsobacter sp.]|uniref:ABC transporter ATP-binding protein n=1 Tax=uncultured Alsobacter sp. TaxID=1748258 RepID=UPI0025CBFDB3|nr:ABC transporter ATP-binding protein [uncultured Alsobacter sp.]
MKLSVRGLAASYDGIKALRGVDIDVGDAEMVALIGANGAGKSTLLNSLSGFVRQRSGEIRFEGQDIGRLDPHAISRRGLLHVPEGRQMLSDMTVLENLQVGVLARGNRTSAWDERKVFDLFPVLEERKDLAAATLSGGQQQMLAIGRALMGGPRLLLLDEPSLGLSPLITDQVFEVLETLNREGLAILLVEQNAQRALAATSRAYVMERGTIVAQGPSAELASNASVIEHYLGG